MPILAALQPAFETLISATAPPVDVTPAELRALIHTMIESTFSAMYEERLPVASEVDHAVPVDGGEITVRIYAPDATSPLPCHVYFHGGGFWLGTLDQGNMICRATAADAHCAVASVDYRLAPEHKFPTAPEDCYAALLWVVDHAEVLGIDASRISVGGGSSGGNLAAVVSLMARDRSGPRIVLQVLEIPVTDLTQSAPLAIEDEGLMVPSGKEQYRGFYLASPEDASDPYASPLLTTNLSDLPPAVVMCAQYDPLRVEGLAFAERLSEAGVPVESRCWEGQFHGSQQMAKLIPDEAAEYHALIVNALRRAYESA
jgi:acetyl esterase